MNDLNTKLKKQKQAIQGEISNESGRNFETKTIQSLILSAHSKDKFSVSILSDIAIHSNESQKKEINLYECKNYSDLSRVREKCIKSFEGRSNIYDKNNEYKFIKNVSVPKKLDQTIPDISIYTPIDIDLKKRNDFKERNNGYTFNHICKYFDDILRTITHMIAKTIKGEECISISKVPQLSVDDIVYNSPTHIHKFEIFNEIDEIAEFNAEDSLMYKIAWHYIETNKPSSENIDLLIDSLRSFVSNEGILEKMEEIFKRWK